MLAYQRLTANLKYSNDTVSFTIQKGHLPETFREPVQALGIDLGDGHTIYYEYDKIKRYKSTCQTTNKTTKANKL